MGTTSIRSAPDCHHDNCDGADDPQTDADRMHDAICDDLSGRNAR
jgi:hypothetical protein